MQLNLSRSFGIRVCTAESSVSPNLTGVLVDAWILTSAHHKSYSPAIAPIIALFSFGRLPSWLMHGTRLNAPIQPDRRLFCLPSRLPKYVDTR